MLTDDTPEYKQIQRLKYIRMVLNETLRLYPTAPAFSLYAKEDTVLGGEYPISKGRTSHCFNSKTAPGSKRLGAGCGRFPSGTV